jgi:hypothetical protein
VGEREGGMEGEVDGAVMEDKKRTTVRRKGGSEKENPREDSIHNECR